jgi:hypothetical protein
VSRTGHIDNSSNKAASWLGLPPGWAPLDTPGNRTIRSSRLPTVSIPGANLPVILQENDVNFCSTCGTALTGQARFCSSCGTAIDATAVVTPAPVKKPAKTKLFIGVMAAALVALGGAAWAGSTSSKGDCVEWRNVYSGNRYGDGTGGSGLVGQKCVRRAGESDEDDSAGVTATTSRKKTAAPDSECLSLGYAEGLCVKSNWKSLTGQE